MTLPLPEPLEIPRQLAGPWEHALFVSYGADLAFFERALWAELPRGCRNRIVLCDGEALLEHYAASADAPMLRHVNQRYAAAGIFSRNAAHAKLLLLTSSDHGRLLVGSGNLNLQGYGSGGEMFARYELGPDSVDSLNAFIVAREFVMGLVDRAYVNGYVQEQIELLLNETPWISADINLDAERPVRHNLSASFLDQLVEEVNGEAVEELWVASPFYDEQARALTDMLERLDPQRATILVQEGRTSVDATALRSAVDASRTNCEIRPYSRTAIDSYLHAKLYLLKLGDHAICVQGSPNLSQVAMLFSDPRGNLETANLLHGARDAFDHLLHEDVIEIGKPVTDLASLQLEYQGTEREQLHLPDEWKVTGADLDDHTITIRFLGSPPPLIDPTLIGGEQAYDVIVVAADDSSIDLKVPDEIVGLLEKPIPIVLAVGDKGAREISNPIYVANIRALRHELARDDTEGNLERVGDLGLEDADLERLFRELDAVLVVDRRSLWKLAGAEQQPDEEEDAPIIDREDLDLDEIKADPRIRQYFRARDRGGSRLRTRLQVILDSITSHVDAVTGPTPTPGNVPAEADTVGGTDAESEEQREEADSREEQRRLASERRLQRLIKSFVKRYLRGVADPQFQEIVGFDVMGRNYVVFSHILWRLLQKDWLDHDFVLDSTVDAWTLFWGDSDHVGYFANLAEDDRQLVREWLLETGADSELLATIFFCSELSSAEGLEPQRLRLRNLWRAQLLSPRFDLTQECFLNASDVAAETFPYDPPGASEMFDELAWLSHFTTREELAEEIRSHFDFAKGRCLFELAGGVKRQGLAPGTVHCLALYDNRGLGSVDDARWILSAWMRAESLDYYRVRADPTGRVCFYEPELRRGKYWAPDTGERPVDLGLIVAPRREWDDELDRLRALVGSARDLNSAARLTRLGS